MLKRHWYKILGVLLLIYVFIAGMIVPLKPGLVEVAPSSVVAGKTVQLAISGYNSNYTKSKEPIRVWLKLDDEKALVASKVEILDDQNLKAQFDIPAFLPIDKKVQDFTLVVDTDVDGPSVLPTAVFITQDSVDKNRGVAIWPNDKVERLHPGAGMTFPFRNILSETIRNTYFHVPLWFAMLFLFAASVFYSAKYLRTYDHVADIKARAYTSMGVMFGLLGLLTGAIWAKNTWGAYWSWDVKQNMTAIALLIYLAYFILRSSFEDPEVKSRVSAVYNIFAFVALIPLIYVIPRMTDSLHPGAGGNPAFGSEDLDNTMRMVFYPAVLGWTFLGFWCANLLHRSGQLEEQILEKEYSV